jgi:Uma2 family endonuclease
MIPMSRSGWLDELPQSMTEADYEALPEEISRTVEVVFGHVIKCESPVPRHNRIARRLSFALESARTPSGPCLTVETDVDVILWRVPRFTFRRPDVVVYQCLDDPARKPTAQETVMVVEVTSPTTAQEDLLDKKTQYAAAGIPLYLVVVLDDKYDIWEIREFHLDAAESTYRLHAVHRSVLELEHPVRLKLAISELITG